MAIESRDRADYACPSCDSTDVYRENGSTYECRNCGQEMKECIAENLDALRRLARRNDRVGTYAQRLLETGGTA